MKCGVGCCGVDVVVYVCVGIVILLSVIGKLCICMLVV